MRDVRAVGIPGFGAVDHDVAAIEAGRRRHPGQGTAGLGLTHARADKPGSTEQRGQHLVTDPLRAEMGDLANSAEVCRLERVRALRADLGDRHHDQDRVKQGGALTAQLDRDGHARVAVSGQGAQAVERKALALEGSGGKLPLGQSRDRLDQCLLIGC